MSAAAIALADNRNEETLTSSDRLDKLFNLDDDDNISFNSLQQRQLLSEYFGESELSH